MLPISPDSGSIHRDWGTFVNTLQSHFSHMLPLKLVCAFINAPSLT